MERIATEASPLDRTALEPLLTVNSVCELLDVSRQTIYRLIERGDLVPIRVSRSRRFMPDDVRRYLAEHRESSRP